MSNYPLMHHQGGDVRKCRKMIAHVAAAVTWDPNVAQ